MTLLGLAAQQQPDLFAIAGIGLTTLYLLKQQRRRRCPRSLTVAAVAAAQRSDQPGGDGCCGCSRCSSLWCWPCLCFRLAIRALGHQSAQSHAGVDRRLPRYRRDSSRKWSRAGQAAQAQTRDFVRAGRR